MASSTFTFWEVGAGELPLHWDDAQRRLDAQARADQAATSQQVPGEPPGTAGR